MWQLKAKMDSCPGGSAKMQPAAETTAPRDGKKSNLSPRSRTQTGDVRPRPDAAGAADGGVAGRACTQALRALPLLLFAVHVADPTRFDEKTVAFWAWCTSQSIFHWCLFEAVVATASFMLWIAVFRIMDKSSSLNHFRFNQRPAVRPQAGKAYFNSLDEDYAVLVALVYLGAIRLFHVYKLKPPLQLEAPTFARLAGEVLYGLWLYDFAFFFVHLALHRLRALTRWHLTHHKQPPGGLRAKEVLHHGLVDGFLQVAVNIAVQRTTPLYGVKHDLSRLLHNVLVTYMLTESHAGYDAPWSLHRIWPRVVGGAARHELHHRFGTCAYQQFFMYLDYACGTAPTARQEATLWRLAKEVPTKLQ